MTYKATVHIMPREEILDPQGKATLLGLKHLGLEQFHHVRIGKRIELKVDADNETAAKAFVEDACKKLLANVITEQFSIELEAE